MLNTFNIDWKTCNEKKCYIDLTSVSTNSNSIISIIHIDKQTAPSRAQQIIETDDVLFGTTRPMNRRCYIVEDKYDNQIASTGYCVLRCDKEIIRPRWLYYIISSSQFYEYVNLNQKGASYPAITNGEVKKYVITLPSLIKQDEIISILDKFELCCNSIKEGIPAEIELRQKQYEYYRNKLLKF